MMVYTIVATFIIIFLLIFWVIYQSTKIKKEKEKIPVDYIKGLEYYASNDFENSFKFLNVAWEKDAENVYAYLKVGDILRIKGNVDAAIGVHKNIIVKPNLDKDLKIRVLRSLAEDYLKKGLNKDAIDCLSNAIKEGDHSKDTRKKLIALFEEIEEWENAFAVGKDFYDDKGILPSYSSYIGLKLIDKESSKAFNYIRTGIKSDIPLSHYAFALYLFHLEREDEGIKEMKNLVLEHPRYFELCIDHLEQKSFQKGKFSELEQFYSDVLAKDKENVFLIAKYAEMMAKKKDKTKTMDLLELLKEEKFFPENIISKIKILSIIDFPKIKPYIDKLSEILKYRKVYKCKECGYEIEKFSFKCPSCFNIDTFDRMWRIT